MTSLGLGGRLGRLIQAVGVNVELAEPIGSVARAGWGGRGGADGAFLVRTVGAGPGGGHRPKECAWVESFAGASAGPALDWLPPKR